jgi:hypothetical protein
VRLFTTGNVLAITGLSATMFDTWCRDGIVKAVSGGDGHGSHRQFTLMQMVGIAVAVELRNSYRGCAPKGVGIITDAFGGMTEEWLLAEFKKRKTHFVTTHHGKPVLTVEALEGLPDVEEILKSCINTQEGGQ